MRVFPAPRGTRHPSPVTRHAGDVSQSRPARRIEHSPEGKTVEFGLKGKVVAITGGSEGIGRAAAMRLAAEGAKVAICARRADVMEGAAEAIRKETGAEVMTMVADASKPEDMPRFIEETVKRYGRIDALVNNAGGTGQSAFDIVDDKAWQVDIDIKVFAQIRTARAAIPH